jgi:hypothetical protein
MACLSNIPSPDSGVFLQPSKKRSKLVLPAPQVSDRDLEDLVKLSKTGADALDSGSSNAPTSSLLQDYNETPTFQAARTPRAPAAQDTLLTEAQNILALSQTSSVLEVCLSKIFACFACFSQLMTLIRAETTHHCTTEVALSVVSPQLAKTWPLPTGY